MVTSHFASNYNMMVDSVFLGLSIPLSLLLIFLFIPDISKPEPGNDPLSIFTFLLAVSILIFGCTPLLKMEIIRVEYDRISYQKQVFASNIKEVHFKNYDYYKTIYEASENGSFEAVWLLKDGKLAKSLFFVSIF